MRTFLAIDVEDGGVRERIEGFGKRILKVAEVKPVRKENLHMTVKFFGELSGLEIEEVKRRLEGLEYPSFKVVYRSAGAFPSLSRPRVVWVGVNEGSRGRLLVFVREVLKRVKGLKGDEKFSPHVTVARVKRSREGALSEVIKEFGEFEFGEDVVRALKLKKSELTPRGPIYTDLCIFRLGG